MRDSSGNLLVVGRIDGGVKLPGGTTIYPHQIEEKIRARHEEIHDAVVLVMERGETTAVVVLDAAAIQGGAGCEEGHASWDGDQQDGATRLVKEMATWASQELPWYQQPAQIIAIDAMAFPRDGAGAPDHTKLVALLSERGSLGSVAGVLAAT